MARRCSKAGRCSGTTTPFGHCAWRLVCHLAGFGPGLRRAHHHAGGPGVHDAGVQGEPGACADREGAAVRAVGRVLHRGRRVSTAEANLVGHDGIALRARQHDVHRVRRQVNGAPAGRYARPPPGGEADRDMESPSASSGPVWAARRSAQCAAARLPAQRRCLGGQARDAAPVLGIDGILRRQPGASTDL